MSKKLIYVFNIFNVILVADQNGCHPLEAGAMWIHGVKGNAIYDYIKEKELPLCKDPERLRTANSEVTTNSVGR